MRADSDHSRDQSPAKIHILWQDEKKRGGIEKAMAKLWKNAPEDKIQQGPKPSPGRKGQFVSGTWEALKEVMGENGLKSELYNEQKILAMLGEQPCLIQQMRLIVVFSKIASIAKDLRG